MDEDMTRGEVPVEAPQTEEDIAAGAGDGADTPKETNKTSGEERTEEGEPATARERTTRGRQRSPRRPRTSTAAGIMAQWTGTSGPIAPIRCLILTVPEDPDGRPWFEILTGGQPEGITAAWDEAQRASDRTLVGRLARPIVALEPRAYRWRVVRIVSRSLWLPEAADFADPIRAITAARTRFGELVRPDSFADDLEAVARTLDHLHAEDLESPDGDTDRVSAADDAEASPDASTDEGTDR